MKKALAILGFGFALLLSGFAGFSAAMEWPGPIRPALTVEVDLTAPEDAQAALLGGHLYEAEGEDLPSPDDIEVKIIPHEREEGAPLRVLIYHTHTYEAYEPDYEGQYRVTEKWRTADSHYNMVRIGAALAECLRQDYGMVVIHDDTAFEPPRYDSAYQRSLEAIENYMARGETFDLYLDIHRNAYIEGSKAPHTVTLKGQEVARVMFLVGKGSGTYQGQAFAQQPNWEVNHARAQVMTEALGTIAEGICRPVAVNGSRYNQHVSTGAFLIEVGDNMNALEEALGAVPYLAWAIGETMGGTVAIAQHIVEE